MAKIGYVRVSTQEQQIDRQVDALAEQGAEKVFVDKLSGAKRDRPELSAMLQYVREGDTLVVESISRLARSTRDLLTIVDELRDKGVELVSLHENIDTTTAQGRFVLSIFAALSELERETLLQRQREGIQAAKRRGKHLGRPRKRKPANFDKVYQSWKDGEITGSEAILQTGLSRATFYRKAREVVHEGRGDFRGI